MIKKILGTVVLTILLSTSAYAESIKFPEYDLSKSQQYCKDAWTKRGTLDQRMYNTCMDVEEIQYATALTIYNEFKSEPLMADIFKLAFKKYNGGGKTSTLKYDLNIQKEGFLDIQYYIKERNLNENEVNKCKDKWYPKLDMVAHCLKK